MIFSMLITIFRKSNLLVLLAFFSFVFGFVILETIKFLIKLILWRLQKENICNEVQVSHLQLLSNCGRPRR